MNPRVPTPPIPTNLQQVPPVVLRDGPVVPELIPQKFLNILGEPAAAGQSSQGRSDSGCTGSRVDPSWVMRTVTGTCQAPTT